MLPAAGQGAVALEVRASDQGMGELLTAVDDRPTRIVVTAERAFQQAVGAGCHAAVAAYASVSDEHLVLRAMVAALDGRTVRGLLEGPTREAEALGQRLAAELLAQGGAVFLEALPNE